MIPDDAKGEIILLAPRLAESDALEREFADAIKGFSARDLYIVARLLERLHYIATNGGPGAALAAIDRMCTKQRSSWR